MSNVFYCSPTNSTHFTTCCSTAILPHQQKCPRCKKDVYPFYETMDERDRREAAGGYYNANTQRSRDGMCRRRKP